MNDPRQEQPGSVDPLSVELRVLLGQLQRGDELAMGWLYALLYGELRSLRFAHLHSVNEAGEETLCTAPFVNEAYAQVAGHSPPQAGEREQFLAFASTAMRHVLVDHARARRAVRRHGGTVHLSMHEHADDDDATFELLTLDHALAQLERADPRLVNMVECLFFGGLSLTETAQALQLPERVAQQYWRRALAWLRHLLGAAGADVPQFALWMPA
jgi:RNA polymerase sigma factor (TIGR02999 family)